MSTSNREPPFILAIDVGSSSVRASLFDAQAWVVEGTPCQERYGLRTERDGTAEGDARDFLGRVNRCIDGVLQGAGAHAAQIAAVGLDTLASTLLGVDRRGRAITPVYTYADTRPKAEVQSLRHHLDETTVHQRTGCPLHMSYAPARLLWLKNTRPEVYQRVYRWMDLGSYLYSNWFGDPDGPMSFSQASWWGLLDRHRMQWDQGLLEHLNLPLDKLPGLATYSTPRWGLSQSFARRWPTLGNLPFFPAVGDGAAANVGSGCLGAGRVALTIGTSGAMRLLLEDRTPVAPPGLWAYRLGNDLTLLGGSFNEGGNVLEWARDTLRLPPMDQLEAALDSSTPDGHGLTVLPFLAGERSPGWSTNVPAVVMGLSTSTAPIQILQALLEAVAYRFGAVWELLAPFTSEDLKVVASGGAVTRSPWWLQLLSDVLQQPVTVLEEDEVTSRGTAILALYALGAWSRLDEVPARTGMVYRPDHQRSSIYREAARRQHQLYHALASRAAGSNA